MPESALFPETLRNWQNFYFMTGGAGATLIGLIFVAVSLGAGLVSPNTRSDLDTFVTPILVHFILVFVTACIMLIPTPSPLFLALLLLIVGVVGMARIVAVIRRMLMARERKPVTGNHWLWHALLPLLSYSLMVGTALSLGLLGSTLSLMGLAFATALLLTVGIWRTWELVIWIAHQMR